MKLKEYLQILEDNDNLFKKLQTLGNRKTSWNQGTVKDLKKYSKTFTTVNLLKKLDDNLTAYWYEPDDLKPGGAMYFVIPHPRMGFLVSDTSISKDSEVNRYNEPESSVFTSIASDFKRNYINT